MRRLTARIQIILIALLIIIVLSLILSRSSAPDNPALFGLKRVQEKAFLKLKSNPKDRLEYMGSMLNSRLDEIKSILNHKNYNYLLSSSLRYSSQAGQITDLIISNNLKDEAKVVKEQFNAHVKILNDLYVAYPKNIGNVEYKYIEDDINYLKIYLEKLSNIK